MSRHRSYRISCFLFLCLSFSVEARRIEIRVLHTTDIHGHILPTRDYDKNDNVGGLLRCATLIDELRAQRDNVLLMDCGDLFQGSIESYLNGGEIMIKALQALKYDVWALGNHEFDWGLTKLTRLQEGVPFNILSANITVRTGDTHPLTSLKPFVVKELDGIRIAILGLITPGVPSWSTPDLLGNLEFERSVQALSRVMPAVRAAEPDIIILATHQGYRKFGDDDANEINEIAKNFPEIDVILGGHSHQVVEDVRLGDVLYTQAGYYANWLGCVDLVYDTVAKSLIEKNARVYTVGDRYPFHAGLQNSFQDELKKAEEYLREPVGAAKEEITAATDRFGRSPIQMLLCKSIAEAVGADVVIHGILADDPLPEGKVHMKDVWQIVPYENRIGVMLLTPSEIMEILNENQANSKTFYYMGVYGLDYDIKKDGNGSMIQNVRLPSGKALHPRKRYRVALNSYVMASGGKRYPAVRQLANKPETRFDMINTETRNMVIEYLKRRSPLSNEQLMNKGKP